MSKAISLHVGVNRVDAKHYGSEARLYGCENDARCMQKIMSSLGYDTQLLLNEQATSSALIECLDTAAKKIGADGIFVISYAGHGSQLRDENGDEIDDKLDETWCLYDRMLVDDELKQRWSKFASTGRVVVISDSCHSGSIARQMFAAGIQDKVIAELASVHRDGKKYFQPRVLPDEAARYIAEHSLSVYRDLAGELQSTRGVQPETELPESDGVSLITISGCQDNQTSADGKDNGGEVCT